LDDNQLEVQGLPEGVDALFEPLERGNFLVVNGFMITGDEIFTLEMIASKFSSEAERIFVPAKIFNDDETKQLWNFESEKSTFPEYTVSAKIFWIKQDPAIAVMAVLGGPYIKRIIPFSDLKKRKPVKMKDGGVSYVGGSNVMELLEMKRQLARQEGLKISYDGIEKVFVKKMEAYEKVKEEEERLRKEEVKKDRIKEILSRSNTSVYDRKSGKRFNGFPVIEEEWPMLDDYTAVIVFDSVSGNEVGNPLEAFFISKTRGGRCSKSNVQKDIVLKNPNEIEIEKLLEIEELMLFKKDEEIFSAFIFADIQVNELKKVFNNGTMVALKTGKDNKYQVYELIDGDAVTIGEFEPIS